MKPRKSIAKFGGTSVKNAYAINKIVEILVNNSSIRFVVISAIGDITDKLIELCCSSTEQKERIISEIKDIHLKIAQDLMLPQEVCINIKDNISQLYSESSTNRILAIGELLSSAIIHAFIYQQNIPVTLLDAREFIITDENCVPKILEIKRLLSEKVNNIPQDHIIITQGFIGATQDGETTTLGRGCSDYSAALIAEGIEADKLYIYTDVPGIFTMDPNVVENAQLISNLSFQEMAEMANFGAKILHPATLAPCIRASIPVIITSTFNPEKGSTYIADDDTPLVRAITMRNSQMLVTIKSLKMLNASGFLSNIFSILAKYKISVDLITTSEVSVALTIDQSSNVFANKELVQVLENFADITIEYGLTLIAVIGVKLIAPGIVHKILSKIGDSFVHVICYGASSSSIGILVHDRNAYEIAKVLHKELIEKK
ncbi:hypothetical protein BIY23_00190 [Wolbachia pipientis]|uniref:Aspartokinase n=1 Tax=Wolbachia pipientis TaxID=955 RepID=A0A1E7QKB0_WOLPI|nr:aspartate kinase [Wolbachia pipientis]OEY86915.1 hypothetical protein BIY23_00190 [Wolbachia pipientis]